MQAKLILLHALSPLHAGTGQGVGVIDLPIARETATNLPYVPGSTLKGILRDNCADNGVRDRVFGKLDPQGPDDYYAGSLQLSDARLLLLPIRSLYGTFAWVTSPFILGRLARDLKDAGIAGPNAGMPQVTGTQQCLVAAPSAAVARNAKVYLEDLDLAASHSTDAASWAEWLAPRLFPDDKPREDLRAWQTMLTTHLCVVHDDVLTFLMETATEVTARIRLLDDKKTVKKGGLWYEEALPSETVLAGLAVTNAVKAKPEEVTTVLSGLKGQVLQVGGKATVGRGLCRFQVS